MMKLGLMVHHIRLTAMAVSLILAQVLPMGKAWAQPGTPSLVRTGEPLKARNTVIPNWQSDRILIKYKQADPKGTPDSTQSDRARVVGNRHGVQLKHVRRMSVGTDVWHLTRRLPMDQLRVMARELQDGDASVEYAEPDRLLFSMMTPSDSFYGSQWDLFEAAAGINAPAAWDKATGAGIVVGVVDTGFRPHADLAANLLSGYDFISDTKISNDGDARDADASDPGDWTTAGFCSTDSSATNSSWHGTHVAGTIAAVTNNGMGVAGIAFGAKILPVRAMGRCGGYMSDVADGMVWAAGGSISNVPLNMTPARVVNLSLGASGACDMTMQAAVNAARAKGAVVVAAAGNSSSDAGQFEPASCAGVVAVAAVNRQGGRASYSNYGSVVSLAAPGGDGADGIWSTIDSGQTSPVSDSYGLYIGTSMATPHVSAVAALMLSVNPSLTPDDIQYRLRASARPFPANCVQCGAGIVDANAAVDAAQVASSFPTTQVEIEPNNTLYTPQAIAGMPVAVNATMSSTSDADYYKVLLPGGKTLTASLLPNARSNYDLYIYRSDGSLWASSTAGRGQADVASVTNTARGSTTVYIRVAYVSGLTGSSGSYILYVED